MTNMPAAGCDDDASDSCPTLLQAGRHGSRDGSMRQSGCQLMSLRCSSSQDTTHCQWCFAACTVQKFQLQFHALPAGPTCFFSRIISLLASILVTSFLMVRTRVAYAREFCTSRAPGQHAGLGGSQTAAQLVKLSQGYGGMEKTNPTNAWTRPGRCWNSVIQCLIE